MNINLLPSPKRRVPSPYVLTTVAVGLLVAGVILQSVALWTTQSQETLVASELALAGTALQQHAHAAEAASAVLALHDKIAQARLLVEPTPAPSFGIKTLLQLVPAGGQLQGLTVSQNTMTGVLSTSSVSTAASFVSNLQHARSFTNVLIPSISISGSAGHSNMQGGSVMVSFSVSMVASMRAVTS